MVFSEKDLTELFQNKFDLARYQAFLRWTLQGAQSRELKVLDKPLPVQKDSEQKGDPNLSSIGKLEDNEGEGIPVHFYHYRLHESKVGRGKVGLHRKLSYWGRHSEAALVVFESDEDWRLSLIFDFKVNGLETDPHRFTFAFGDPNAQYRTAIERFTALAQQQPTYNNLKEAFSVEALTNEFYRELERWYQLATDEKSGCYFPHSTSIENDDTGHLELNMIRLITRLIFVWFIKQKGLVPEELFDEEKLRKILKEFHPEKPVPLPKGVGEQGEAPGCYYNAILQNLFFATLNRPIDKEHGGPRGFAELKGQHDVRNLYRYQEMFKLTKPEILDLFAKVPFLNGGLFECLDKVERQDGKNNCADGFSRNPQRFTSGHHHSRYRAHIPDWLFFDDKEGLIPLLGRYNFTVEENTPLDQQVALDPELLGKVFENLLGTYNPETHETARHASGSFYTPRSVVHYMVDASLKAYLLKAHPNEEGLVEALFKSNFEHGKYPDTERQALTKSLKSIKVLDPACGSGAFPMGMLHRLVDLIHKLQWHASASHDEDYQLKCHIIENCLYGVDKQPIAVQITKLRFFISLICECEKQEEQYNSGLKPLPNLETKFVAADTLKKLRLDDDGLFTIKSIPGLWETFLALKEVRKKHFGASNPTAKKKLREQDATLCGKLKEKLPGSWKLDEKKLSQWDPYDQSSVAPFFSPLWMFGVDVADGSHGFDVVIGNPPYIQLQSNQGTLAKEYKDQKYQTLAPMGDIYALFYERGVELLKSGGHLCYITSNKWMRAGYGEKLRAYFTLSTRPLRLVDFAGEKVFSGATVDTNILLLANESSPEGKSAPTQCATVRQGKSDDLGSVLSNLDYTACTFPGGESWVVLSPLEQRIKAKVEAHGVPLRDWDITINYGIKTGCNEAFVVDGATRARILAECQSAAERARTEALIRPLLRGRDIRPWGHAWAGLYLIATHNGIKGKRPRVHIDRYPAVKKHLDKYWPQISTRADKGDTPYNLRNCAYWDDFSRPKLLYSEIVREPKFYLDPDGQFLPEATTFMMTGQHLEYLLAVLQSSPGAYFFRHFYAGGGLGDEGFRYKKAFLIQLPIPPWEDTPLQRQIVAAPAGSNVENLVCALYHLTEEEQAQVTGPAIIRD